MRAGHRVEMAVPQRGEKRELVDHAAQNSRETLARKLADSASQEKLLEALAASFGIEGKLRRIEVYDNSHIMGTNAVGAMIVAGPGGFMKSHYRTFNIKGEDLVAGRRYRHDARSAAAPVCAAQERGGGSVCWRSGYGGGKRDGDG